MASVLGVDRARRDHEHMLPVRWMACTLHTADDERRRWKLSGSSDAGTSRPIRPTAGRCLEQRPFEPIGQSVP